jgi:broad specificity phosphatase PhoE
MRTGTELWLMRHGETAWSASGQHTSRTDVGLTEKGQRLAERLGIYLAGKDFSAVLCSPMRRARETCELAGFGDVAVVDERLKEWDYGVYEGKTTQEIRDEIPGWNVWRYSIVGGESLEQVGERADGIIRRALEAAGDGGRVALFAHAHILRILGARWIGLPASGGQLLVLGTGCVSVLGFEREARSILKWNREFEG